MTEIEQRITELTEKYQWAIGGEHHKDRDCHWAIVKEWSYGDAPTYLVPGLDSSPRGAIAVPTRIARRHRHLGGRMTDTRLLDAIDALTKPTVENVKQTTDDGEYLRTVPVEHPPLLQQLAEAVVPSAGNDGGSKSSSARERNVLDSDVLWELTRIETALRDWLRHDRAAFDRADLPATLRRWYVGYDARPFMDSNVTEWHVRELRRWERVITVKLDRSIKQIPTGYLCVLCKDQQWIDGDGERQPARLILSYRRDDEGRTSEEQVICQRCRTRWDNWDAIKELGEELTEVSERMST